MTHQPDDLKAVSADERISVMTSPLRDAAENATAGVPVVAYRTDIFESLPNGKLSRLILEAGEVSNPDPDWTPLVPASELDTARAEIERLRQALKPFADTFRQHNDPGVSDLYNEQPVAWHVPLGAYRVAAALSPAVKEPK